jgi:hypothetical protein
MTPPCTSVVGRMLRESMYIGVFLIFLCLIYLNSLEVLPAKVSIKQSSESGNIKQQLLKFNDSIIRNEKKILILLWNDFFWWPDFGMGYGNKGLVSNKCPVTNCYVIKDKRKHQVSDAIVFHGTGLDKAKAPRHLFRLKLKRWQMKRKWPVFVFFQKEAPGYVLSQVIPWALFGSRVLVFFGSRVLDT